MNKFLYAGLISLIFLGSALAIQNLDTQRTQFVGKQSWSDLADPPKIGLFNRNLQINWDGRVFEMNGWGQECGFILDLKPVDNEQHNVVLHDSYTEWGFWLDARPKTNVFSYPIYSWGIDWLYQPGEINGRPDSVVGSYALYHNSCANDMQYDNTYEQYRAGKFAHVYRPKAWDARGIEAWCEMFIDTTNGVFTISIPSEFLDASAYPIYVDPDFGYTTEGGSLISDAGANMYANYGGTLTSMRIVASGGDQVTKFFAAAASDDAENMNIKAAVYVVGGSDPDAQLSACVNITDIDIGQTGWDSSAAVTQNLTGGTTYCVAQGATTISEFVNFRYDAAGTNDTKVHTSVGSTCPDPFVASASESRKYSLYARYTSSSSGPRSLVGPSPVLDGVLISNGVEGGN